MFKTKLTTGILLVVVVLAMALAGCGGGGGKKGGNSTGNTPNASTPSTSSSNSSGVLKLLPQNLQNTTWEGKDQSGATVKVSFTTNDFTCSKTNGTSFKFSEKYRGREIYEEVDGLAYSISCLISATKNQEITEDFALIIIQDKLKFMYTKDEDVIIYADLIKK